MTQFDLHYLGKFFQSVVEFLIFCFDGLDFYCVRFFAFEQGVLIACRVCMFLANADLKSFINP